MISIYVLIFALMCFGMESSVLFSSQMEVCDGNSCVSKHTSFMSLFLYLLKRCAPSLVIVATIRERQDWEFSFQIPNTSIFSDSQGGKWKSDQDIVIDFVREETRMEFPLQHVQTSKNAYVERSKLLATCPPTSHCCSGWEYKMKHNETSNVDFFRPGQPLLKFKLKIDAQQGASHQEMILSHAIDKVSDGALEAEIVYNVFDPLYISQDTYISVDRQETMEPFLVLGKLFVGSSVNRIGISNSNFLLGMNSISTCTTDKGRSLFRVDDGLFYNQFSSFVENTFENRYSASWYKEMSHTDIEDHKPLKFSVKPHQDVNTMLSLKVEASSFKIKKLYAKLKLLDSGSYPVLVDQERVSHYIELNNTGLVSGQVNVVNTDCCYGSGDVVDCEPLFSSRTAYFEPSESKKITMAENIQYLLYNTTGYCYYVLKQHGVEDVEITISFDYTIGECKPPFFVEVIDGKEVCKSHCSIDQVLDLETNECNPADCWVKYGGARNWYDPVDGLCKPAPQCEYYDPETNTCVEFPGPQNPSTPTTIPSSPQTPSIEPVDCGPNGEWSETSNNCKCNDGWSTDLQQPIFNFKWCTVKSVSVPTKEESYLKQSEVIAITCVCIAVLIGAIVGICIVKRKCKKRKKKEVDEESGTDPTDESTEKEDISPPPSPKFHSSEESDGFFEMIWNHAPSTHEGEVTPHGLTPFSSHDDNGLVKKIVRSDV